MPEKDKKLLQRYRHGILQRWCHGSAAVTVNSDCVEVILFGGVNKNHSRIADTVVVRFGGVTNSHTTNSFLKVLNVVLH